MNAGEVVAEILKREGVEQIFCFPSNALIDAAAAAGIRPIVAREERTVINMADAFSRVSNGRRIGVCMVQAGPGAEHAFGSVAQAFADSVPLLLLTGGAPRAELGVRSAFDSVESFRPITKWVARFTTAASVPTQLRRAFAKLRSGRPGPVVLEMPSDVVNEALGAAVDYVSPVGQRGAADPLPARGRPSVQHRFEPAQDTRLLRATGVGADRAGVRRSGRSCDRVPDRLWSRRRREARARPTLRRGSPLVRTASPLLGWRRRAEGR